MHLELAAKLLSIFCRYSAAHLDQCHSILLGMHLLCGFHLACRPARFVALRVPYREIFANNLSAHWREEIAVKSRDGRGYWWWTSCWVCSGGVEKMDGSLSCPLRHSEHKSDWSGLSGTGSHFCFLKFSEFIWIHSHCGNYVFLYSTLTVGRAEWLCHIMFTLNIWANETAGYLLCEFNFPERYRSQKMRTLKKQFGCIQSVMCGC